MRILSGIPDSDYYCIIRSRKKTKNTQRRSEIETKRFVGRYFYVASEIAFRRRSMTQRRFRRTYTENLFFFYEMNLLIFLDFFLVFTRIKIHKFWFSFHSKISHCPSEYSGRSNEHLRSYKFKDILKTKFRNWKNSEKIYT